MSEEIISAVSTNIPNPWHENMDTCLIIVDSKVFTRGRWRSYAKPCRPHRHIICKPPVITLYSSAGSYYQTYCPIRPQALHGLDESGWARRQKSVTVSPTSGELGQGLQILRTTERTLKPMVSVCTNSVLASVDLFPSSLHYCRTLYPNQKGFVDPKAKSWYETLIYL